MSGDRLPDDAMPDTIDLSITFDMPRSAEALNDFAEKMTKALHQAYPELNLTITHWIYGGTHV